MASQSDTVRERPETQRWRGIVEDFIDLKPEEHAYECVLKHTDNLLRKVRRDNSDVDAMVSQGVIRPLVDILKREDQGDISQLQHTAVQVLRVIVDRSSQAELRSVIAAAGVIPHLLSLLRLRPDEEANDVLQLLETLVADELVSCVPGCIEALLEATHRKLSTVKHSSLRLIQFVLSKAKLPAEKVSGILSDLIPLLDDEDEQTVFHTCEVFTVVVVDCDISAVQGEMSSGVLQHFVTLLQKARIDKTPVEIAGEVLFCARKLAEKSKDFSKEIMQEGLLEILRTYLKCSPTISIPCIHASWLLAHAIYHHDDNILEKLVGMNLVPLVVVLDRTCSSEEKRILPAILPRFLTNSKYLEKYLESHFLSYLVSLQKSQEWPTLRQMLTIFGAALEKVDEQGKLADVKEAILKRGHFERLCDMQHSPDEGVKNASVAVVALCLK